MNLSEFAPRSYQWDKFLSEELEKPYMKEIKAFLVEEKRIGIKVYPRPEEIFYCFRYCYFNALSVVIIGIEPYSLPNNSHGLAYSSVSNSVPPSLQNVFREIWSNEVEYTKAKFPNPDKLNLRDWKPQELFETCRLESLALQGVLLLNVYLTVQANKPASHRDIGWEKFASATIEFISKNKKNIVFMLWGSTAQSLEKHIINPKNHLILKASHPNPVTADKGGWFGCKHFLKANEYLLEQKEKGYKKQIQWFPKKIE